MIKMSSRPGIIEIVFGKEKPWHYNSYKWDKLSNLVTNNENRYIEPEDIHYLGFEDIMEEDKKYLIKVFLSARKVIKE